MQNGLELLIWRKQNRYSQSDLAAALRTTRQTVSNWENDRHRMPRDMLQRLTPYVRTVEHAPPQADYVTYATDPHMYEILVTDDRKRHHIPVGVHPRRLTPHLCTASEPVPYTVLQHPDYIAALATYRASR